MFKKAAIGAIGLITIGAGSVAIAAPYDNNQSYQRDYRDNGDSRGFQNNRGSQDQRFNTRRDHDRRFDYRLAEQRREQLRREAWLRAQSFHDYSRNRY